MKRNSRGEKLSHRGKSRCLFRSCKVTWPVTVRSSNRPETFASARICAASANAHLLNKNDEDFIERSGITLLYDFKSPLTRRIQSFADMQIYTRDPTMLEL